VDAPGIRAPTSWHATCLFDDKMKRTSDRFLIVVLLVSTVPAPSVDAQSFGNAGFDAWVSAEEISLVPSRERLWPTLGILRYGDRVRVVSCSPSCDVSRGWATLAPYGALRVSALRPSPRPPEAAFVGPEATFRYGRIVGNSVVSRRAADTTSTIVDRFESGDEIVMRPEQPHPDFFERPDGSFVPIASVTIITPSAFEGWTAPPDRFAFAFRPTTLTRPDGTTRPVMQYERFTWLGEGSGVARLEGGAIPRSDVRAGHSRRRAAWIPSGAKWVHLDLRQQMLTAYEGDELVYATLVSAGRHAGTTQPGRFRVFRKLVYTTMTSSASPDDTYLVEGVRWVQYFHGGVALHMAYWHDRFGTPMSHGCVNLSPADSRWLFDWSPGAVPSGWRGLDPLAVSVESLHVFVENSPR